MVDQISSPSSAGLNKAASGTRDINVSSFTNIEVSTGMGDDTRDLVAYINYPGGSGVSRRAGYGVTIEFDTGSSEWVIPLGVDSSYNGTLRWTVFEVPT